MCLLGCSYFLFTFTDFVPEVETRYLLGWGFIGIAAMNIFVNFSALFYKVFLVLRLAIRKAIYNWRLKRALAVKAQMKETSTTEAPIFNTTPEQDVINAKIKDQDKPLKKKSKTKRNTKYM